MSQQTSAKLQTDQTFWRHELVNTGLVIFGLPYTWLRTEVGDSYEERQRNL